MNWWQKLSAVRRVGLLLIVTGLVALAGLLPARMLAGSPTGSDRSLDWATLVATWIEAVGVAVTMINRVVKTDALSERSIDEAADRLTDQVRLLEMQELARLLGTGQHGTTAARLHYHRAVPPARAMAPDATAPDTIHHIGQYLMDQPWQRLVILGPPGAGKTVLAMMLLTQLMARRDAETDPVRRTAMPVPVRFNLPRWDPARSLTGWLADEVATRFGLPAVVARCLVQNRRILPILDGLDEMDDPTGEPVRAEAAITDLNAYLCCHGPAPAVVTCRAEQYQRLRDAAGIVLKPATEITVEPLGPEQIREYLDAEYDCSVDWERRHEWEPVLDAFDDQDDQRLLGVLGTPWRLALAVAYHRNGGDLLALLPRPVESPTGHQGSADPDDLHQRRVGTLLLSSFIPARTNLYGHEGHNGRDHRDGRAGRDRSDGATVVAWFRAIAVHLGDRTDLVPTDWWRAAGPGRVRRAHAVTAGALSVALWLAVDVARYGPLHWLTRLTAIPEQLTAGYHRSWPGLAATALGVGWYLFILLVLPLLAVVRAARPLVAATRTNPRQLRTVRGRRRLLRWFALGAVIGAVPGLGYGLSVGLTDGLRAGLTHGVGFGLCGGVVFALGYGLRPTGETGTGPIDPLRDDLIVWVAASTLAGLINGLATGLAAGPGGRFTDGFVVGAVDGSTGAAVAMLAFGLAGQAWLRYAVAVTILAGRGRQPLGFGRLLDWGHRAGILRIAGDAYQFRHTELRDWLRRSAAGAEAPTTTRPRPAAPADVATTLRRRRRNATRPPRSGIDRHQSGTRRH